MYEYLYDYMYIVFVGMVVLDSKGNVAGGTSTNGLNHKIPGYVHIYTRNNLTFCKIKNQIK